MKLNVLRILPLIGAALLLAGCGLTSEPKTVSTLVPEQPTAIPPVATADAALSPSATKDVAPQVGVVTGTISNDSPGGKVPADLAVVLHITDAQGTETATLNGTAGKDGTFTFKDVTLSGDRAYRVTTRYLEHDFDSGYTMWQGGEAKLTIPLKLYELTADSSVLSITSFTVQANADTDALQVALVVHITNTSKQMYSTSEKLGDGKYASVRLTLPQGTTILDTGDSSGRFSVSADGRTVTDTQAVVPDEDHLMHVVFAQPYQPTGTNLEFPVPYAMNGAFQMMISPASLGVTVTGGGQNIPAVDAQGAPHKLLAGNLTLPGNAPIRIQLVGDAGASASGATSTTTTSGNSVPRELILGVLIGGGITLITIGGLLLIRERSAGVSTSALARKRARAQQHKAVKNPEIERLIAELAKLDDLRAQKKIGKDAYEKRRTALKNQIAKLMESSKA